VIDCAGLGEALVRAVAIVKDGGGVVVDVRVTPQITATAASPSGERK
jgi:hypothetical protein